MISAYNEEINVSLGIKHFTTACSGIIFYDLFIYIYIFQFDRYHRQFFLSWGIWHGSKTDK